MATPRISVSAIMLLVVPAILCSGATMESEEEIFAMIGALRNDADREARALALTALGKPAVAPLVRYLSGERPGLADRVAKSIEALAAESWDDRDRAARELATIGVDAKPFLQERLKGSATEIRWRISQVIAAIERQEKGERGRIHEQEAAICAILGRIGDASCSKVLGDTLGHPEGAVRIAAAEAIGALALKACAGKLEQATAGKPWREQCALVWAMGRVKSSSSTPVLIALLKESKNLQLSAEIFRALVVGGEREGVRAVVDALGAPDAFLRAVALKAVATVAGEDFGFDPLRDVAEQRAAVEKTAAWWEKRYPKREEKTF